MTGVIDFLFGGSKEKTKGEDVTPSEIAALRGPFAQAITQLIGAGTGGGVSGVPAFSTDPTAQATAQGALTAPITGAETDILSRLAGEGEGRRDLLDQTIGGAFLPGQQGANPFLQATIEAAQRPTIEALEETLSRVLPGRFTQAGQFIQPQGSSPFDRAAAIATRGAGQTLGDIASQISFGAFEGERGRQQEAIQLSQQEVETGIQNLQAQALPRLIQELGIERGLAEFQSRIQTVIQALAAATGAPLVSIAQEGEARTSPGLLGGIGSLFETRAG